MFGAEVAACLAGFSGVFLEVFEGYGRLARFGVDDHLVFDVDFLYVVEVDAQRVLNVVDDESLVRVGL